MKTFALFCTLCLCLFSCKEASNSTTTEPETPPKVSEPKPEKVSLACNFLMVNEMDIPYSEVILVVGDKETILDTIHTCQTIPLEDFSSHEIPAKALSAVGGWFAGAGDYFYVVRENDGVAVYAGWQDEMQEDDGFHWKKIQ